MAPGARSKFGALMFDTEVCRKQMYCIEGSTLTLLGLFGALRSHSAPRLCSSRMSCAWHHMKMSKRICRILAKLSLTSFSLEHFRCTLPAPGKPPLTSYKQQICKILRILLERPHQTNQLLEGSP